LTSQGYILGLTSQAVPEKGWVSVTVRESTKKALLDQSTKNQVTIDDLIMSVLTSQAGFELTSQDKELLRKTHQKLVAGRNTSQADVLKKILDRV